MVERQRTAAGAEANGGLRVEAACRLGGTGADGIDVGTRIVPHNGATNAERSTGGGVDAGQLADVDAVGAAQLGAVGQGQDGAGCRGAQRHGARGQASAFTGDIDLGVAAYVGRAQRHGIAGQHGAVAQAQVVAVSEGAGVVPARASARQFTDRVDGHALTDQLPAILEVDARVVQEYATGRDVDRVHLRALTADQ